MMSLVAAITLISSAEVAEVAKGPNKYGEVDLPDSSDGVLKQKKLIEDELKRLKKEFPGLKDVIDINQLDIEGGIFVKSGRRFKGSTALVR